MGPDLTLLHGVDSRQADCLSQLAPGYVFVHLSLSFIIPWLVCPWLLGGQDAVSDFFEEEPTLPVSVCRSSDLLDPRCLGSFLQCPSSRFLGDQGGKTLRLHFMDWKVAVWIQNTTLSKAGTNKTGKGRFALGYFAPSCSYFLLSAEQKTSLECWC